MVIGTLKDLGCFLDLRHLYRAAEDETYLKSDDIDALNDLYCRTRSEGFGKEVQRRILSGTFVLSEGAFEDYYERAIAVRQMIREDFQSTFDVGVRVYSSVPIYHPSSNSYTRTQ